MVNFCILSIEKKLDLELVMTYPLMPVPLSLCNLDESTVKTNKSTPLKTFEKGDKNSEEPKSVNVTIIDGFFFLHLLKDPPTTFEGLVGIYSI